MSTWASLFSRSLGGSGRATAGVRVERLSVRAGEAVARVRGAGSHEVSLIRPVAPEAEWERLCAALASQPVFRARVLAGELPAEVARVFALLGWDLVPRGWGDLVATCSCDQWGSRCPHLLATAQELGAEADRDPFTLTRWLGRERRALVAQVRALFPNDTENPPAEEGARGKNDGGVVFDTTPVSPPPPGTSLPHSAAAFWSAPPPPPPPLPPPDSGKRVRQAAPGIVADDLPGFGRTGTQTGT